MLIGNSANVNESIRCVVDNMRFHFTPQFTRARREKERRSVIVNVEHSISASYLLFDLEQRIRCEYLRIDGVRRCSSAQRVRLSFVACTRRNDIFLVSKFNIENRARRECVGLCRVYFLLRLSKRNGWRLVCMDHNHPLCLSPHMEVHHW